MQKICREVEKDEKFEENWKESQKSGLYIGAYHFFSFDSPGKTQAKNFMKYVKLYIKIYLTMNQMIGKELVIT